MFPAQQTAGAKRVTGQHHTCSITQTQQIYRTDQAKRLPAWKANLQCVKIVTYMEQYEMQKHLADMKGLCTMEKAFANILYNSKAAPIWTLEKDSTIAESLNCNMLLHWYHILSYRLYASQKAEKMYYTTFIHFGNWCVQKTMGCFVFSSSYLFSWIRLTHKQ